MLSKKIIQDFSKYCCNYGWQFDSNSSEFTFQFRLGWFLNEHYKSCYLIDFETNVKHLNLNKKEIDLFITKRDNSNKYAIEIKFIKDKNGYDLSLFKFCEDLLFLEQLKEKGQFIKTYAIAFSIVKNSYTPSKNGRYNATNQRLEFYKMFREEKIIKGVIKGNKDQQIELKNSYVLNWFDFTNEIKVCLIEV